MNTTVSKSFGLALLLAVGIIAVMVALGTFSSQKVGADTGAAATHDAAVETADVGLQFSSRAASAPVEISTEVTSVGTLNFADPIRVRMKGYGLPDSISAADVFLRGTGDLAAQAGSVLISGGVIVIEVGDMNAGVDGNQGLGGGDFTIVFRQSAGITNPAIAGVYHIEVDANGDVATDFNDAGPDTRHVRINRSLKLSPTSGVSGEDVAISGTGYDKGVSAIYIEADPAWLKVKAAKYYWSGMTKAVFSDDQPATEGIQELTRDEFFARTGATSPTTAGVTTIYAVDHTDQSKLDFWIDTVADGSATPAVEARFDRMSTPSQGPSDEVISESLGVSDGKFSTTVTVDNKFESGPNPIFVQDAGGRVEFLGNFNVNPSIELSKGAAQLGDEFDVTFHHFTMAILESATIGGESLGVPIRAGTPNADPPRNKYRYQVPSSELDSGIQQVRMRVGDGTSNATVDLGDQIANADLNIGGLPLSFSPAVAVPGQQITIKGRGFSRGATIATIEIGDVDEAKEYAYDVRNSRTNDNDTEDDTTDDYTEYLYSDLGDSDRISKNVVTAIRVSNSGDWTGAIKVPEWVDETDDVQVVVTEGSGGYGNNRTGVANITIPKPTVTVEPESSRPGSTVTIEGSGFTSKSTVLIYYDGLVVTSALTDTTGVFNEQVVIPIDFDVAVEDIEIRATTVHDDRDPAWAEKEAFTEHDVPPGILTVTPEGGPPGTSITINGEGFKAFTPFNATIGGLGVLSEGGENTDGNGHFSRMVVVPPLREGIHSITVTQQGRGGGTNTESISFEVGDIGPAIQAVEVAFEDLIDNGSLTTVWRYDFDTRSWTSYTTDPETSFGNDLFEVESGDILYVHVSSDQVFSHQKGSTLMMGWSLITLN